MPAGVLGSRPCNSSHWKYERAPWRVPNVVKPGAGKRNCSGTCKASGSTCSRRGSEVPHSSSSTPLANSDVRTLFAASTGYTRQRNGEVCSWSLRCQTCVTQPCPWQPVPPCWSAVRRSSPHNDATRPSRSRINNTITGLTGVTCRERCSSLLGDPVHLSPERWKL